MPGAGVALQPGRGLLDLDPRLEAGGVHLLERRREEEVDARSGREARVARLVPRVRPEIGLVVELGRVDEERRDDRVVLGTGGPEEREMTVVEGAHRRHEADAAAAGERRTHLVDRADRPHVASTTVAAASVS